MGGLTTMDLSELGGEYHSLCARDFESCKLVGKKKKRADKHDKESAALASKALSLATKKWKGRLLQVFEMLVLDFLSPPLVWAYRVTLHT